MIASPQPLDVPMRMDKDGVMRVGNTRIPLQTVIEAYHQGETPEQIVSNYDVLKLPDIYAVLAYYLSHQKEIDEYIQEQTQQAQQLRQQLETDHPEMFTMQTKMKALLAKL